MVKIANIKLLLVCVIPMGIMASGSDTGPASHSGVHASTADTAQATTTTTTSTSAQSAGWGNDIGAEDLSEQFSQERALRHIQFLESITPTLPPSAQKVIKRINSKTNPESEIRKIVIEGAKGTGRNSCAQAITLATHHRAGMIDLEQLHSYRFSLPKKISELDIAIDEQSPLMMILLALDTLDANDKDAIELIEYIIGKAQHFGHVKIMATISDSKKLLPVFNSKLTPRHIITTSLPTAISRKTAIEHHLAGTNCEQSIINKLVEVTEGLSCSGISLICNEVIGNASVNNPGTISENDVQEALDFYHENYPQLTHALALKPLDDTTRENYLRHSHQDIPFIIQKIKENNNSNQPGSNKYIIILIGPAGSGKTTLAQALGEAAGKTCFKINPQDVLTKYQNCIEDNLKELILPIAQSQIPAAIIIDEFKHLISTENGKKASAEYRSRSVWSVLDQCRKINPNLVIIGTTNDLEDTIRPLQDRMSEKIQIDLPNQSARRLLIMNAIVGSYDEQECSQEYLDWLINRKTNGRSYRDINQLLNDAKCHAKLNKRTIHATDFNFAMRNWTEWYHLRSLWATCQPNILPTLEKLTPLVFQAIGLYLNYQGVLLQEQFRALQIKGQAMQTESHELACQQFEHAKAAHAETVQLQKTHHDMNQENQEKSFKLNFEQFALNYSMASYQNDYLRENAKRSADGKDQPIKISLICTYLRANGYSPEEIDEFLIKNKITDKRV